MPGTCGAADESAPRLSARVRRSRPDARGGPAARGVSELVGVGHAVSDAGQRAAPREHAKRSCAQRRASRMQSPARTSSSARSRPLRTSQRRARCASHLKRTAYFLDLNSVSPGVKARRRQIDRGGRRPLRRGGDHVADRPKRIASPMLLGGPHAAEFLPLARQLGFAGASVLRTEIGQRVGGEDVPQRHGQGHGGAARRVAAGRAPLRRRETRCSSRCADLFPARRTGRALARYMISRSLLHGRRRAEEMREVARTVGEAGVEPRMSSACARAPGLGRGASRGRRARGPRRHARFDARDGRSREKRRC